MKPASVYTPSGDRLLTFEVGHAAYALPIEAVLEVAEAESAPCIPGLPQEVAAVMNWHGDTLTLVASRLLVASAEDHAAGAEPGLQPMGAAPADSQEEQCDEAGPGDGERTILRQQVLVLSDRGDGSAMLGMPVDRVIGLVDGAGPTGRSHEVVVERRPVDGRVISVLDPQRLVERAEEIIQRAAA
jgi:chemotaxis signal transduction protein